MAEAGKSVVDALAGNILYISVMNHLSVDCDCNGNPAEPDMHDIGILASADPVALDQACADACNAQQPIPGSLLDDRMHEHDFCDHHDHFVNTTPESEWETCLAHAEKIGIGTREYELIEVK